MACSRRTVSGCLRSHHYPTRSPVVINDNRLEYWFVNLQSGAIRCRLQNCMILSNAGRVCICVNVKILVGSKLLLELFCQNIPATAVVEWWMPNLGVVYVQSGWCWNRGCSWGELAWYVRSYALTQSVRILDQTGGLWWWRVSEHFIRIPATLLPPVSAPPFASLPHCRVIRTMTLYERGEDNWIYTQSLAEEYISFAFRVWTWVHEHGSSKELSLSIFSST